MGWFDRIQKTVQAPLMLNQMGEDIFLSRVGDLKIDPNIARPISAIVRVTAQEATTSNGQGMIELAEVLLPVRAVEYQGDYEDAFLFYDGKVERLTTAHIVSLRGQIFTIESIGTEYGGFRKLTCRARKQEFTNRSTLNGRF